MPEELTLTKAEAYAVASHIDATLLDSIRNDVDIDSIRWLKSMVHALEKLCAYSGYQCLTDSDEPEGERDD